MATSLTITAVDQISGSSLATINLMTGNVRLAVGGLELVSGEGTVVSTFRLVSTAGAAAIKTQQLAIDKMIEYCKKYNEAPNYAQGLVWLYVGAEGETVVKRALVYEIKYVVQPKETIDATLGKGAYFLNVAVKHEGVFEAATQTTYAKAKTLASDYDSWDPSLSGGDYPARISEVKVTLDGTLAVKDFWIGIKDKRGGTPTVVKTVLTGHTLGADTSSQADTPTTYGNSVRITYATASSLTERVRASNILQGSTNNFGRYLLLLRGRVNNTSTVVNSEVRFGFLNDYSKIEAPVGSFTIDGATAGTAYFLYECGMVEIPTHPRSLFTASNMNNIGFTLYSERVSGSGTAFFETLYMLPADHLATFRNTGAREAAFLFTAEGGQTFGMAADLDAGGIVSYFYDTEHEFHDWEYPWDGGVFYTCFQGTAGHVLNGSATFDIKLNKRYKLFQQ